MKKINKRVVLLLLIISYSLSFSNNLKENLNNYYVKGCNIPYIIIETITYTENNSFYPYFIRTNNTKDLKQFKTIISKYKYKETNDPYLIDCLTYQNCIDISNDLIKNKELNLDLGLRQINYKTYPKKVEDIFDVKKSFFISCNVLNDKINITNSWDWSVIASYHSLSAKQNEKYKQKLLKNYYYLINNKDFIHNLLSN